MFLSRFYGLPEKLCGGCSNAKQITANRFWVTWGLIFAVALISGCGGGGGASPAVSSPATSSPSTSSPSTTDAPESPVLDQLQLSVSSHTLPKGLAGQLTAIGIYPDKRNEDLTQDVTWSSADDGVVSVDGDGVVTAVDEGSATVSAVYGDYTATLDVTVSKAQLAKVSIFPRDLSIPKNLSQQLVANGTYSDGSIFDISNQVAWESSEPSTASVVANGVVTAWELGSATVTAYLGTIQDSTTVEGGAATLIEIDVSEPQATLPLGRETQLNVIGILSDNTKIDISTSVDWSCSDDNIATVAADGLVTSKAVGRVTVVASLSGITRSVDLDVSDEVLTTLQITPNEIALPAGADIQVSATGVYSNGTIKDLTSDVTWQTSDVDTATVSNADERAGLVTANAVGVTTLTAYLDEAQVSADITVNSAVLNNISIAPAGAEIPLGNYQTFTATGYFSDGSTQDVTDHVQWRSSNTGIANSTDEVNVFTSYTAGASKITGNLDNVYAFTELTVTAATLSSISIAPLNSTIPAGTQTYFSATASYSDSSSFDITHLVTWKSSDTDKAAISNFDGRHGVVTALEVGEATISAVYENQTDNTPLTVSSATLDSIAIQVANSSMNKGDSQRLTAIGSYSDSSTLDISNDVTWSSSQPTVASIDNAESFKGIVSALDIGSTNITAALGFISETSQLSVVENPDAPASVAITTSPNVILNNGADSSFVSINLNAISSNGTVADGTIVDIEIREGSDITPLSATSTNGNISFSLASTYEGVVYTTVTIRGTNIETESAILSTTNFSNAFISGGFMEPIYENGIYKVGSVFVLYAINYSNRVFDVVRFEMKNDADVIAVVSNDLFSDGQVSQGESLQVFVNFANDTEDNGISAYFYLGDPTTATGFTIGGSYVYSDP